MACEINNLRIKKLRPGDFPGGPVVRTLWFHWQGLGWPLGCGEGVEFKEKNNLRPWLDEGFLMELQCIWKLDWVGELTSKLTYMAVGWGSSSPPAELLSFPHSNQLLREWVTHKKGNIREQPKTSLTTWSQQQYINVITFALVYWSQRPILL